MIYFPKAKINIGLNIVERRPDGYHNIETVFYPIALTDVLEIVPGDRDQYFYSGLEMPPSSKKNLVEQAVDLLRTYYNIPPITLYLKKGIPAQAGLGGGSSDASAVLVLLNQIFNLNMNHHHLINLAEQLGADCPFFIRQTPQFATGTGNIFTSINLKLKGHYLLIIKPDIAISTKEAYALVDPKPSATPLPKLISQPIERWKELIGNDFEKAIFPKFPILQKIKTELYNLGACYAAMSGSGSALYGIFTQKPQLPEKRNNYFTSIHELEL